MENPGILVIDIYSYYGTPWTTEYLYIRGYRCPSAPHCTCFMDSKNFTVRSDIASAVVYCGKRSSKFCVAMNQYARSLKQTAKRCRCLVHLNFVLHQDIYSRIDYAWGNRLTHLSYKWSLLVDATAWLSTLGGGHSALGEHSLTHAHMAGSLSVKQFKLALELGDKGLEYRCRLYYALSLIQQGHLLKSKRIIQWIFKEAQTIHDQRLLAMCQGVWSKLRYHLLSRKHSNHLPTSCSPTAHIGAEGRHR